MSMSANLHHVTKMHAHKSCGCGFLHIENDVGDHVGISMPYDTAVRIVAAFYAVQFTDVVESDPTDAAA